MNICNHKSARRVILASDSARANLALAKVAAHERSRGAEVSLAPSVEWALAGKARDPAARLIASWIFTRADGADIEGGPASLDPAAALPAEVENAYPDWACWPEMAGVAAGCLTRGCPRRCAWCVVPQSEGAAVRQVSEVCKIWRGEARLEIMDANLLALPDRAALLRLLSDIAQTRALIEFKQGLDCRLIDDEIADALSRIRMKQWQIACDSGGALPAAEAAMRRIWKAKRTAQISCFIFTDWRLEGWMESALRRIETLRALDLEINFERDGVWRFAPFVMLWKRAEAPQEARDLQRWANHRAIFKTVAFSDYKRSARKEACHVARA